MNAVVLDKATVGQDSMVAAMSFVKMGGEVPPRVLWTGIPGKVARELSDADIKGKSRGTDMYVELAVETPSNLSKRQRELLEEFAAEGGEHSASPESQNFFDKAKRFWDDLVD